MKEKLHEIFQQLDAWMEEENIRRRTDDDYVLSKILIQVLGQCSLILHPSVHLRLFGTYDLDAVIKSLSSGGLSETKRKLTELLYDENLELESDAHLIWLPVEATFTEIMDTPRIKCEVVDPLYALCSKAIKAKEKNKALIRDALIEYGDDLKKLIQKYGGDLEYFK
jgi:hypothetical protein